MNATWYIEYYRCACPVLCLHAATYEPYKGLHEVSMLRHCLLECHSLHSPLAHQLYCSLTHTCINANTLSQYCTACRCLQCCASSFTCTRSKVNILSQFGTDCSACKIAQTLQLSGGGFLTALELKPWTVAIHCLAHISRVKCRHPCYIIGQEVHLQTVMQMH